MSPRIHQIEASVKHDVIAFTMAVGESIGDPAAARWLHYGLTSNDVVDTAQALQVRDASRLIERDLVMFGEILDLRAHEFRYTTPQIGRTHGIHAEPITFGLKIANWFSENQRNIARFRDGRRANGRREDLRRCWQLIASRSGDGRAHLQNASGSVSSLSRRRSFKQRDRHAQYLSALALIAAMLETIALEIRHLQRTEVREAEEPFSGEQRGSSAMPHKRNPVTCEQICGLARLVRSNMLAAFENIALWHERDISHSSVERIILPRFHDSRGLHAFENERRHRQMRVFLPERMMRNLESTRGLILTRDSCCRTWWRRACLGMTPTRPSRKTPWRLGKPTAVSRIAFRATRASRSTLDAKALAHTFDLQRQLRYVDAIFDPRLRRAPCRREVRS